MLCSTIEKAPSDTDISLLNHTPHTAAVYVSWPSLPPARANTHLQEPRYALPWPDFHWRDRASLLAPSLTHPTALTSPAKDAQPRRVGKAKRAYCLLPHLSLIMQFLALARSWLGLSISFAQN